jgi:hypothetical protein
MKHKYFILIPLIYETLKYMSKKLHMKLSQVHAHHQHQFEIFIKSLTNLTYFPIMFNLPTQRTSTLVEKFFFRNFNFNSKFNKRLVPSFSFFTNFNKRVWCQVWVIRTWTLKFNSTNESSLCYGKIQIPNIN